MKIVFVFHDGENYVGGPSLNAVRLLPQLEKLGHELIGLCIISKGSTLTPNATKLQEKGIKIYYKKNAHFTSKIIFWILKKVKEVNPDIFVPNISTAGCFAGKWIKEAGIPVINTYRSDDQLNNGRAAFFTYGPMEWRSSGIVCVSEYLRLKLFEDKKEVIPSAVIPSGVDLPEKISNQESNPIKVVYAGRLEQKQKRVLDMISTFVRIASHIENIEFTILGSGSKKEEMQNIVSNAGLSNKILFKGAYYGDNYKKELSNHNIIVLLSDYEGISGSLMDGMSCGLVPLSLNIPGIHELIEDGKNGFILQNREDDLLNKILRLQEDNNLRNTLARNARDFIKTYYSLEITAKKWESFCKYLITNNPYPKKEIKIPRSLNLPGENDQLIEYKQKNPRRILKSMISETIKAKIKSFTSIVSK